MGARDEVDKKNIRLTNETLAKCPKIVGNYINSLTNKTTYTKMVYARYVSYFIDYIKAEFKFDVKRVSNYKKIKPMDISTYVEKIRHDENGNEKSVSYVNVQLAAVKGFFEFLELNDVIEVNPCRKIKQLKDDKIHEITVITDRDLTIMLKNIQKGTGNHQARAIQKKWINRDVSLLMLGLTTGLRISAIVGIDVDDVDLENRYILVTEKGNKQKKVIIGDRAIEFLTIWLKDRERYVKGDEKALFICKTGRRMSADAVDKRFAQIAEGTGKRITPHKMRATCATRLYEQTGDIYLVQQQLGHKNIENTKKYTKVSDEKMAEAATILNNLF